MNLMECVKNAFQNVFSNKSRTLLTMLGIIIGISSVIIIVAIGNGSQAAIEEEFESFGTGSFTVSLVGSRDIDTRDLLTMDDYYLLEEMEGIQSISPTYTYHSAYVKLLDPRETNSATITGVTADYQSLNNDTLLYGRYLSNNDVNMKTNVCVIYDTTAQKVFGRADESVINQQIQVKSWKGIKKYTVIGVLQNTDTSQIENPDEYPDTIYVPITSAMKNYYSDTISNLMISVSADVDSDQMKDTILATLEEFHGNEDKYYIMDTTDMMDSINSILSYVTLFIGFVAAISLLVGGIGVMNIMMVTVTERTREIGIRKAIGAKNKDIRFQFLVEAILLTGSGGLLGLLIGWGGSYLVGALVGIVPVMSLAAIIGAVGVSMGIGIIFGVTPANQAAKLDPIEALRYE